MESIINSHIETSRMLIHNVVEQFEREYDELQQIEDENKINIRKLFWNLTNAEKSLNKFETFIEVKPQEEVNTSSKKSDVVVNMPSLPNFIHQSNPPRISNINNPRTSMNSSFSTLIRHLPPQKNVRDSLQRMDLSQENLFAKGYMNLARALKTIHPNYVNLTFVGSTSKLDCFMTQANPYFSYPNSPIIGWRRDVCVRQGGKSQGSIEIAYMPPSGNKRLRGRFDLQTYASTIGLSAGIIGLFDFRTVYCVCHQPMIDGTKYLECSYGKAGCNGRVHPHCVGLNIQTPLEIYGMENVICPYCAYYLDGIPCRETYFSNKRVLRSITIPSTTSKCEVNGKIIEESNQPPSRWGSIDSQHNSFSQSLHPLNNNSSDDMIMKSTETNQIYRSNRSKSILESSSPTTSNLPSNPPSSGSKKTATSPRSRDENKLTESRISDTNIPFHNLLSSSLLMGYSNDQDSVPSNQVHTSSMPFPEGSYPSNDDEKPRMNEINYKNEDIIKHDEEELPLDHKYRRALVDFSLAISRPVNRKKKHKVTESDSREHDTNNTNKADSQLKYKSQNLNQRCLAPVPLIEQEPILTCLPVEGGSIKVGCVSEGCMPRSLHPLCKSYQLCAYCLSPFDPSSSTSSSCNNNAITAAKDDRKMSKKKRRRSDEEVDEDIKKADITVGIVSYDIHEACHYMAGLKDTENQQRSDFLFQNSNITIGPLYEYEEVEDADCDLCGRIGGILQYFNISSFCSKLRPPLEEGWLGHIPCIYWLIRSGLCLERSSLTSESSHENFNKVADNIDIGPHKTNDLSLFDREYNSWKCVICNNHAGICTRCCATGCSIRVHPLCAIHASKSWKLYYGHIKKENDSNTSRLLFFCSGHSHKI